MAVQNLSSVEEWTRPHASVTPVELLGDQQGDPRNAGPPEADEERVPLPHGWGPLAIAGVHGYGQRLPDGTVQFWRPLPARHAPDA